MPFPPLEAGQPVLVALAPDEPPWRMLVDLVQDGRITLAMLGDEPLPAGADEASEVHVTVLGRFSVYLVRLEVVRSGESRLVVGTPSRDDAVQRRAYARVLSHVPASCTALDAETNTFSSFEAEVRDLGGGGCSLLTDITPHSGATVVVSFAIDEDAPFVAVGRVLPRDALPTIGKPLTRLEFVLIRESDRDRILRFVLHSLSQHRHAELRPH